MRYLIVACITTILSLVSCAPSGYYQKDYNIKDGKWMHEEVLTFDVDISDTTTNYNTFILIRHDDNFPTSNIWLKLSVMAPGDSTVVYEDRMELLMADTDGKPLGKNFGDIWEQKKLLSQLPPFKKVGTYKVKLAQVMRSNPLDGVLNVGLQIEKNIN